MASGFQRIVPHWGVCVLAAALALSVSGCHARKPIMRTPTPVAASDINNGQGTRLNNDTQTRSTGTTTSTTTATTADQTVAMGPAVYFAYDSSEVSEEYNALLDTTAKRLLANKSNKLRLEGNTDERGSAEYNIGLGERRAQAVKHALTLRGVAESQLSTVSYGAERPQSSGHDESAWSKNRRVDLIEAGR
jgi:peptidoglycan-associated lipoprotein